ncbi:hypothetical protein LTR66_016014, partial [Elasticomyces elasticus]
KEVDTARRERWKKAEEDLKVAIEASKASKAEDDHRLAAVGAAAAAQNGREKEREKENGIVSGGLNMFRRSSLSLRQKPKFWPGKEKEAGGGGGGVAGVSVPEGGALREESAETLLLSRSPEKEKVERRNRFSLGKKKSGMLG